MIFPLEEISGALMNVIECHIPCGTTSKWTSDFGEESLGRKRKEYVKNNEKKNSLVILVRLYL